MGRISVFDTLTAKSETINANGKLKNIFPEINFNHSLVLKKGCRLDGKYEVQPEDVLFVRKVPAAATTIAIIAVTVAVVAVGVGVGAAVYANKKSEEARKEMEKAQRNAQNMAQQTQQLPFIRGAKNKNALGNAVQFVMGSVYSTPYNLTNGFYSIDGTDGENSYYNAVFSAGYGSQKITEILLGNETLVANDSGISGEVAFDTGTYKGCAEVRQPGSNITLTNCNYKVSSTYSGVELKHEFEQDAVPVTVQAASNAMRIQVCIAFNALRYYDSENETWTERTAVVRPYWSNNGGSTWNEFTFTGSDNNSFTKNSNKTIRFVAEKTFSASESYGKDILIKVEKETPKMESGSQEDCVLLWYQTFCYDAATSTSSSLQACTVVEEQLKGKLTRVAYRIIANDNTESMLDELHCMSQGLARTWSTNTWSQSKTATRNPAAWLLEVLTSDIHAPSKYQDSEIYLPSFGALYEYCETNSFYCDGIVSESIKKKDLIEKILTLCNSTLIINADDLLEVRTDKLEINPVALLNSENIISMQWSKSFARKLDGKKITFTNRDSWTVDTFYSMLDGGSYDYTSDKVDTLALDYVTTYNHAYKLAQRKMREEQLMPQVMEVEVGSEGDYYPLYSTILMQLPQLLQGLRSSTIQSIKFNASNEITEIVISDAVEFVENTRYGVVIQATNDLGYKLYNAEVLGEGMTRKLVFATPVQADSSGIVPSLGNHLSFGLLDNNGQFTKITHTMKIYGIAPSDKGGYKLTIRNYNPDVYSYGGSIPEYKSNITKPQTASRTLTIRDFHQLQNQMNDMQQQLIAIYSQIAPMSITADVTSAQINTDENGRAVLPQRIETTITVRQGTQPRNFSIGEIIIPNGWEYEVVGSKITFFIKQDAVIKPGRFKIPVYYNPVVSNDQYEDEEGNEYQDENELNYIEQTVSQTPFEHDLWFTYTCQSEGAFLGTITAVEDIPELLALNDYFVWGGEQTASNLSINGQFMPGRLYKYIGLDKAWKWEEDTDIGHNNTAMGDILNVAQADLQKNNSRAYDYLDHLTANQTFVNRLVANFAFITKLFANKVIITEGGSIQSENFDGVIDGGGNITNKGSKGWAVDNTGAAVFNEITANGFYIANNTPFQPLAMINFGYKDGVVYSIANKNVASISRSETGVYTIYFTKPIWVKTHGYGDNRYIDIFAIGNAAEDFTYGFTNTLQMNPNWLRQYVDGRLTESGNYALVNYVVIYCINNNTDELKDPRSAQCFIYATETD